VHTCRISKAEQTEEGNSLQPKGCEDTSPSVVGEPAPSGSPSTQEEHLKITKEGFNNLIQIEREAQDEKWGEQRHSDEKWLAILLEELGEVSAAVLEKNEEGLLEETVQVAAVLQNWITSRNFFCDTETHH